MGLKNDVELQLINFQKAYNSLDASAEDYDAQLANLQNEYNLNLDANQIANSKGIDQLSLNDADSVRKRMLLNTKRDRKYARQEKWENAGNNIVSTAIGQVGNIISALSGPDPNSISNIALSEQVAKNNAKNAAAFAQKQEAWKQQVASAQKLLSSNFNKQAVPGQGIKLGESQVGKQGMKIEYMNLFK